MIIVRDDREKTPWHFPGVEIEVARLDVGDYTALGYEDVFAVERKSLDDLARSLGYDRERFEDEIQRAQSLKRFVVVIEATEEDARNGHYYSRIHPNVVTGTVQKWPQKYDVLEFEWAGDRESAAQETLRLLDKWYLESLVGLL